MGTNQSVHWYLTVNDDDGSFLEFTGQSTIQLGDWERPCASRRVRFHSRIF